MKPYRILTLTIKQDAENWKRTDEGYLDIVGYATRYGIFDYYDRQGNLRREYRPEIEVFNPESYNTLKLKAHTNLHPDEMLDSTNTVGAGGHLRGVVTEEVIPEGDLLKVRVRIYDENLIQLILSGALTELSCGYYCDIDETPGVFNGQSYDVIQRNIRYNHLSSVPKGRAGERVKFNIDELAKFIKVRMDSNIDIRFDKSHFDNISNPQEEPLKMWKITLDGKEIEVTKEVYDAYHAEKIKNDQALATQKKDAETAKGELTLVKKQLDEFNKKKDAAEKDAVIALAKPFITLDNVDYSPLSIRQVKELALSCQQDAEDKTDLSAPGISDDFVSGMFQGLTKSTPNTDKKDTSEKSDQEKRNTFDDLKKQIKNIPPASASKSDNSEGDSADKIRAEREKKDTAPGVVGYLAERGGKI